MFDFRLHIGNVISGCLLHVIVVTQAQVLCRVCTQKPKGKQHTRASADISDKDGKPVLQLKCYTSSEATVLSS